MRRRGFTLIEVMLALAILGMAAGLLAAATPRSLRRLEASGQMQLAGDLAQRKLVELVQAGQPQDAEETAWAPMDTSDVSLHASWKKRVALVPMSTTDLSPDPATSLRLLEVSIRLDDNPDSPAFRLATLFPPTQTSGP